MRTRSTLPSLMVGVLAMLACQFLSPVKQTCLVHIPGTTGVQYHDGDEIAFAVDDVDWKANVDCSMGRLVEGQPIRPADAREISLAVMDSTYRLITADPNVAMVEYRANGSHVRIDVDDRYYVAVLSASSGNLGHAVVRYFIAGEGKEGILHLYCYNQTKAQDHTALPGMASMWSEDKPVTVSLVCSGHSFILELSTQIGSGMLSAGPTPQRVMPASTEAPSPP